MSLDLSRLSKTPGPELWTFLAASKTPGPDRWISLAVTKTPGPDRQAEVELTREHNHHLKAGALLRCMVDWA